MPERKEKRAKLSEFEIVKQNREAWKFLNRLMGRAKTKDFEGGFLGVAAILERQQLPRENADPIDVVSVRFRSNREYIEREGVIAELSTVFYISKNGLVKASVVGLVESVPEITVPIRSDHFFEKRNETGGKTFSSKIVDYLRDYVWT